MYIINPYGYGSIPINTIFSGIFTSILTQLFWCELQGYYWFWHTAIWIIYKSIIINLHMNNRTLLIHNRDWLVVSNIFYFPFHIWDNPSHWLSYFSGWLKPPTRRCTSIWICDPKSSISTNPVGHALRRGHFVLRPRWRGGQGAAWVLQHAGAPPGARGWWRKWWKNDEKWWKKLWKMMGKWWKNDEKWWENDEKWWENDEKMMKKWSKNDEKMMKNDGKMMKNDGKMMKQWWKNDEKWWKNDEKMIKMI